MRLSWQNFCRDKIMFVATSILLCFVTTITRLSWQKWYLWQLPPMVFHRHHHTTLHDDDRQEAHVRVCVISRCPLIQCWTKIKVTAWATAAFRQANNCAWPAGVPSLNAGLKTRCHCLGNCCIQKGKCQCITSRCPITKCWTSKKKKGHCPGNWCIPRGTAWVREKASSLLWTQFKHTQHSWSFTKVAEFAGPTHWWASTSLLYGEPLARTTTH